MLDEIFELKLMKHVVILVHGIRDIARWRSEIRQTLEDNGFIVEPTNYGRMNLFEFLLPFSLFRERAIGQVWTQIQQASAEHEGANFSIIAHSFGTYIVANILKRQFNFKVDRVIFCGSVVKYDFPFEQIRARFTAPLLNHVGTADPYPALAESTTTGYGSAGTYGFYRPGTLDIFHNGAGHGYFLNSDFCQKHWVPVLLGCQAPAGDVPAEQPPLWVRFISIVKIKYILGVVVAALLISGSLVSCTPKKNTTDYLKALNIAANLSSFEDQKDVIRLYCQREPNKREVDFLRRIKRPEIDQSNSYSTAASKFQKAKPNERQNILTNVITSGQGSGRSNCLDGGYEVIDGRLFCKGLGPVLFVQALQGGAISGPKLVVIHYSGSRGIDGVINYFSRSQSSSYHVLIDRNGEAVQLASLTRVAFHSGSSTFGGMRVNRISVGIGLENLGLLDKRDDGQIVDPFGNTVPSSEVVEVVPGEYWHKYSDQQILALNQIIKALRIRFGQLKIIGHSEFAPQRLDPGLAFPWGRVGRSR